MPMLEVKNLGISFGGLRAVDDFNLSIEKGELYGLIGPNGAGKTTVFNMLTGVYKPTDGKILLDGEDVTGKKTIELNKEGIARTFQNIRLFSDLSVLDNVKVALHNQKEFTYSALTGILRLPRFYRLEKEMDERAMELLGKGIEAYRRDVIWIRRRIIKHPICLTASSGSWRLPELWRQTRSFCCWTSRPRA